MIDRILEKNLLPDFVIRFGIRRLLRRRLNEETHGDLESRQRHLMNFIEKLKQSPIAVQTEAANQQHYEIPSRFFQFVLGSHLKYSSGLWNGGVTQIDQSEEDMLNLTCERADLADGQNILELGCGWGSLSLFIAEKFPASSVTAVSNSKTQKEYVDAQARQRGLKNLSVKTSDMNDFQTDETFDRAVSVEMFEHMRNYQKLLEKISTFLTTKGKLFVHIFTHRELAYLFEVRGPSDWMSKYFFSGGMMPSDSLLLYFQDHFRIVNHWRVQGTHYSKTSEAWLQNMDHHISDIKLLFADLYGKDQAGKWLVYWRVFFMACAELWRYDGGNEWFVSHYLFERR